MRGLHTLLLVSLLMCFSVRGRRVCGKEAIRVLQNITKLLYRGAREWSITRILDEAGTLAAGDKGDATDGTLYTPEDITVCMAENLNCFHTELRVIQWEHREHTESLSLLIRHLSQLEKLRTCKTDRQCHPCEGHREQPMPQFLSKLLEQLQWDCWVQGSNMHSCPSWPG